MLPENVCKSCESLSESRGSDAEASKGSYEEAPAWERREPVGTPATLSAPSKRHQPSSSSSATTRVVKRMSSALKESGTSPVGPLRFLARMSMASSPISSRSSSVSA